MLGENEMKKIAENYAKKPLWYKLLNRSLKFTTTLALFLGSVYATKNTGGLLSVFWIIIMIFFGFCLSIATYAYATKIWNWVNGEEEGKANSEHDPK